MSRTFHVLILATALLLATPIPVQAAESGTPVPADKPETAVTVVTTTTRCAEVGAMDRMLMKDRKLAFLATSVDKAEAVHIYFVNRRNGDWVEMIMDGDLTACIVNEGTDWHFVVGN